MGSVLSDEEYNLPGGGQGFAPYLGVGLPPKFSGTQAPLTLGVAQVHPSKPPVLIKEDPPSLVTLPDGSKVVMSLDGVRHDLHTTTSLPHANSDESEPFIPDESKDKDTKTNAIVSSGLNKFELRTYTYRSFSKGELTLFSRILGGSVGEQSVGIIQEAKLFADVEFSGKNLEYGLSVRINVAAKNFDAGLDLNLPNLAASAQLGTTEARMEMSVWGFSGPLGELLPAPTELDLKSYVKYLEAFEKVQRLVFGETGIPFRSPVYLGVDA